MVEKTKITNNDGTENAPLIRVKFRQKLITYSDGGVPSRQFKNAVDIVFRGEDKKDLLITFEYELDKKGSDTKLVLMANMFETEEYRKKSALGRQIAKLKRQKKSSDKYTVADFSKTDAEHNIGIASTLQKADLISDLKHIEFNNSHEKINEILQMAQNKVVEAWAFHQTVLQKEKCSQNTKTNIG